MIKLTFKTPQRIMKYLENQEALFVFTLYPLLFANDMVTVHWSDTSLSCFPIKNIKSIEHVKPTDL